MKNTKMTDITGLFDMDNPTPEQKAAQEAARVAHKLLCEKRSTTAKQYDNIHNDGGEGYNPYR